MTLSIVSLGFFSLMLWLALPQTSIMKTFGYPETVDDIHPAKYVLKYLQDENKALVRTVEVLRWFIFIFVVWFLAALGWFAHTVTKVVNDAAKFRDI